MLEGNQERAEGEDSEKTLITFPIARDYALRRSPLLLGGLRPPRFRCALQEELEVFNFRMLTLCLKEFNKVPFVDDKLVQALFHWTSSTTISFYFSFSYRVS